MGRSTEVIHPDRTAYDEFGHQIDTTLAQGLTCQVERLMRRKDGSVFWALLLGRAVDPQAPNAATIWNIQDISERKRAEDEMRLIRSVFLAAGEGIMVMNGDRRIEMVNPAFTEITGYTMHEAVGKSPNLLRSGRHDRSFFDAMWDQLHRKGGWEGDVWNRRKDGSLFAQRMSVRALRDHAGKAARYVAVFHDITHRKEDEERAWHRANYDALTNLPNRALFLDRLQQAEAQADREDNHFALLFIDLDGFKAVNDSLGHARGDDLLQQVAARLLGCVRAIDTVGRLGGDEFVVILGGLAGIGDAVPVADKILLDLARPFDLGGTLAHISGSIGIAAYPDDSRQLTELMDLADHAMYAAKRNGRNRFGLARASGTEPL
jgi:diguanylate cyclase (GGDEF)-like protein/PAS domain S-box-containing protein